METDSSLTPTGFIVGVDIGGSKVAAGSVSPTGEIHYHTRVPMLANDGPAAGLATVTSHRPGFWEGSKLWYM
jgi:predicted NBD/HSP70 family sugar kinase